MGKGDVFAGEPEILGDGGGTVGAQLGWKGHGHVDWKQKGATNGSNAAKNVGAVDWAAIPSIAGGHGRWDPDVRVVPVVDGDGDGLVYKPEVTLHTNHFVVSLRSCMKADVQRLTHGLEGGTEVTARIYHNHAAHAELQKKLLKENPGEVVGRGAGDG